jgi:uncharacterized protein involved in outer membrane biogenesis
MSRRRAVWWIAAGSIPAIIIILLVFFWSWDWSVPMAESRASAALGRQVAIRHLHVSPGRITVIRADDVTIGNPPGWGNAPPLANIHELTLKLDLWTYLRQRQLVLPLVSIDQPRVNAIERPDGSENYRLQLSSSSGGSHATKIGDLRIQDGEVHAVIPNLKSDFHVSLNTQGEGDSAKIVAEVRGTYGGQEVTGRMAGGALLSLRDTAHPWPIDLRFENGNTYVALTGTLQQPLALKGADLKLEFAGPDMSQLDKLTGIPVPKTPPFEVTGELKFAGSRAEFRNIEGHVGNSDLEGMVSADASKKPLEVNADLQSRRVDLADLGGFVGTQPGRVSTPGQTPNQRRQVARAEASPKLLPQQPLSLPRLSWANVHLKYHGRRIEGRNVPLDDMSVALDVVNGAVAIHPVSFGVGSGTLKSNISLTPEDNNQFHAKADIAVQGVDVSRLMASTHLFQGAGKISGTGDIDGTGNSVAGLLANGDGELRLGMVGGNLSALLVNLSGLEFTNALLSAMGLPERTKVECLISDSLLRNGNLKIRTFILDTGEAIVHLVGGVDLRNETLDLSLRTDAKHFTIGSLPTPIEVAGPLKRPSIRPGGELVARGGAAIGLGVLFPPLAVLPTIQFGVGDSHRCEHVLAEQKQQPGGHRLPSPNGETTSR